MSQTTVLITGANRGLGLGVAKRFLALPNHTVIAPVRRPEHETSKALVNLPKGEGSSIIVPTATYDATSEEDAFSVVKELVDKHDIKHLDIVLANAGGGLIYPSVLDVTRKDIADHMELNVYSVVTLYQATHALLKKSTSGKATFAIMGSSAGSLARQPPVPNAAYGAAKCTLPWYALRISSEDEWLNSYVLDPGFVQTEGGNSAAKTFGMEEAPTTVDESTEGLFNVISTATKEKFGGKVVLYTGEVQAY
ncbi:hypothetical protein BD289DRAFT_455306 [Coniella lustricola]|uniref:NAD(P)-binding protein n=1 Tax=Coniella lustricola TaxID=2025994 RepID=A0A2T3A084_9PEZI|nr:hypothetical protein BD289DRAFT_455306 [Coniella lustricola]